MEPLTKKYKIKLDDKIETTVEDKIHTIDDVLGWETLGIEKELSDELLKQKVKLKKKQWERVDECDEMYKKIDLDFLSISHPEQIIYLDIQKLFRLKREAFTCPRFAVYRLTHPECVLHFETDYRSGERLGHPIFQDRKFKSKVNNNEKYSRIIYNKLVSGIKPLKEESKIIERIKKRFLQTESITSTFKGIIPGEVKNQISNARKFFKHDIYVVAEAEKWHIKYAEKLRPKPKILPLEDPLVIGINSGGSYLISEFDCTPIEEYVKREFVED
jgi:hypothetical protein